MASKQASEATAEQKHYDSVSDETTVLEETELQDASYRLLESATVGENHEASQSEAGQSQLEVTTVRPAEQGTVDYVAKIGTELKRAASDISEKIFETEQERRQEGNVVEALRELVHTVVASAPTGQATGDAPNPIRNTQQLEQIFDDAIDQLIKKPVADQNATELLVTFLKCTTFTILLVKRYKQSLQNTADQKEELDLILKITARLLVRACLRYDLHKWVGQQGGWVFVYKCVHDYITRVYTEEIDAPETYSLSNQFPSMNTIVLVAGVIVVTSVIYRYYI